MKPTKILYVDDEAMALKYFERLVSPMAPVLTATSVEAGRTVLREHGAEIAVLVCDQRMPGEQGNELLRHVTRLALVDTDPWVRHQGLLTLGSAETEVADIALASLATQDLSSPAVRSAIVSGLRFREAAFLDRLATDERWRSARTGRSELLRDLASCVARERLPEHLERIVALALAPPPGAEWWRAPLLEGLLAAREKGPTGELRPLLLPRIPRALQVALEASPEEAQEAAEGLADAVAAVELGCTWPGKPGAVELAPIRALTPEEEAWFSRGEEVYAVVCATCHQPHGGGEPGKAPSLRGSDWVLGDPARLGKILLHGLGGPIVVDGETWNQEMPRFEGSIADLAAVATFVRRAWGHGAEPLAPEFVAELQRATAGRSQPYTVNELR